MFIGEDDSILYESYSSNHGNPVDVVLDELKLIYNRMNSETKIAHAAVTGYGEDLVKSAFNLDEGLVETIAHYQAARHFNPNVDFIIDIGGQDMKCFKIKDQSIDSILLNEACSSGCGSFLETFANSMGYDIQEFSKIGLKGQQPVDLGTRCTVFMNSSVKSAQKNGASIENISAGLSMSVVKNALYKVIRAKNADEVGQEIVVQGGTFLNDTVLRSFEKELGRNVVRPAIAHLMGAYGSALFAKTCGNESTILSSEEIDSFEHKSIATTCGLCTNKCSLTINSFKDGSKHISGNKCERPISGKQQKNDLPDLFKYKYEKLRSYESHPGERGKIGLPLVLNMFENLPFWHTFFDELDYEVVWSEPSSKQLYAKGQHTIPSDTACYPAKLVHGHIQSLLDQGVKKIFYPSMTYNTNEKLSENYFNCPVVAYYPEVIHANMEVEDIDYMYPYLSFEDTDLFVNRIQAYFEEHSTYIEKEEIALATNKAFKALKKYQDDVKVEGAKAIQFAQENKIDTIILAGRPYHVDPQVNHGINGLLTSLGFVVISEDALPYLAQPRVNVLNQWTYHARMYNAANVVANLAHTELVQLVNFGCGIDSITGDEVSSMLHRNHKLYTQLKIDEIDNLGAVKIRCRSLQAAMKERSMLHGY